MQTDLAMVVAKKPTTIGLPQELVLEILSWLPGESLWKLRSVCKYWWSLVVDNDHDPILVKLHLDRAIAAAGNRRSILYQPRYEIIYQIMPPLLQEESESQQPSQAELVLLHDCPLPSGSRLEGCCNGLLCFSCYDEQCVVLVNPSTRRLKFSPRDECVTEKTCVVAFNVYGLGYDSTIDDYKVVRIHNSVYCPNGSICKWDVRVYSMRRNSWRKLTNGTTPDYALLLEFQPGIFFNGAIHWMTNKTHHPSAIISFDVKDEEFQRMLLPPCDGNTSYCRHLMIMRECLGMVRTCRNGDCEVWLMKEYGRRESWAMESRTIHIPLEVNIRPEYFSVIGNQILFRRNFTYGKMVMYDMEAKKTDVDITIPIVSLTVSTTSYVQSLVSLNSREPSTAYLKVRGQEL